MLKAVIENIKEILRSSELNYTFKTAILDSISHEPELIDELGLEYIKLIDCVLKDAESVAEKKQILEFKLLSLIYLDYPEQYLINNGINTSNLFAEYLNSIESLYNDGILFLSDDQEFILSRFLPDDSFPNGADILEKAACIRKIKARTDVLMQMYLITHSKNRDKIEILCLKNPIHYKYDNVVIDWYWRKENNYDYYLKNNVISAHESQTLYKIADVIDSDLYDTDRTKYEEMLLDLYYEFVDGRTFSELIFPDYIM